MSQVVDLAINRIIRLIEILHVRVVNLGSVVHWLGGGWAAIAIPDNRAVYLSAKPKLLCMRLVPNRTGR